MKRLLRPPLGIGRQVAEQLWTLNPIQWQFVSCEKRFSFYVGGVGAGKTFAGAVRTIMRALDYPGSLGLIGAPTYAMLRDATQRTFFELLPELFIQVFNKAEGHLTLHNGSEILFRSLDEPDRVRGLNLAWFWLDEAPLCGYYAWMVLKGRLRQRGYPTSAWATGTPQGRDGFARDFELERRRNHTLFRASTYSNLHHLPPDYVAELGYTGAFHEQEVMGKFSAFEGLVYAFDTGVGGHVREPGELTTERVDNTETEGFTAEVAQDAEETQRRESIAGARSGEAGKHGEGEERPTPRRPSRISSSSSSSATSAPASASSAFNVWKSVIGGIDWGYTNPTAAVVFGVDGDGRAWQLDEFYRRKAALEETVLPAVLELTRAYGVTTWYCGPDEPEHIARLSEALTREGLRCRARRADNAIAPGIQTVTGLLARREDGTRGLYVAPRCVHTIAEYLSYQYETPASGPFPPREGGRGLGEVRVSELPIKQNDHLMDACFAAGTAVETDAGPKPIEDIRAGDWVLTRKGYRPVLSAGMTKPTAEVMRVILSDGSTLTGTPNHPVFVNGAGYIPLRALRCGDTLVVAQKVRRELLACGGLESPTVVSASSTRASSFGDTHSRVDGLTGCTTHRLASFVNRALAGSIRRFGRTLTGQSRQGTIFTTETVTHSTTRRTILNAYWVPRITTTICRFLAPRSASGEVNGSVAFVGVRTIGAILKLGANGIKNWRASLGRLVLMPNIPVSIAVVDLSRGQYKTQLSSVLTPASPRTGEHRVRTVKSAPALSVASSLLRTDTVQPVPAPVHVVQLSSTGDDGAPLSWQPVYNLEVQDVHEYFAQGVLVHNCRYALHTAMGQRRATRTYLDSMRRPPADGNGGGE